MAETVTVSLYQITNCTYASEKPELKNFGKSIDIFEDVSNWVAGLASVGETTTFEPNEDEPFLRTFCFDIRAIPGTDKMLIALWNESSNSEDELQTLEMTAAIGTADVSNLRIQPGSLPGYAAYFVVSPKDESLINLRFENRLNGSKPFARYVLGFLERESSYCHYDPTDGERLLGYAPEGDAPSTDHTPVFKYQLMRRPGSIDWLRQQCSNIRKIIRRTIVYPKVVEHKPFFDGARKFLGLSQNNRLKSGIKFEYSYKTRLGEEELDMVIDECLDRIEENSWEDVGFIMAKSAGKIHWLSGSYAREKSTITVRRTMGGIIDTADLADQLSLDIDRLISEAQK
ncbi:hypothetical protein [Xanthomonas cannabis]|uniref:hypothetical protein n=1 Tax=Xanthomonas cannabis TaxID=1885674 RepID=UPI00141B5C74|nr:hypothetical protein [Xanthomonas cannabis]NIK19184.1 hypothetical protein [Xanthomonas cannabis]